LPLKPEEKRKNKWFKRWGYEQVEIDALAALRPLDLDKIARKAVAPYFDFTYAGRYAKAMELPKKQSDWFLKQPAYRKAKAFVEQAYQSAVEAVDALDDARTAARAAMQQVVDTKGPDLLDVVVEPVLEDELGKAVFNSKDDFVTATLRLRKLKKAYDDLDPDDDFATTVRKLDELEALAKAEAKRLKAKTKRLKALAPDADDEDDADAAAEDDAEDEDDDD